MEFRDRPTFLNIAGVLQGGIVLSALALGAWCDIAPLSSIRLNVADAALGAAAILPMLLAFWLARPLRKLVVELLGPALALCTWYDLVLLAALAGFGEELLFRGTLQPWVGRLHPVAGLIGVNVLFGLLHALTPAYAVLATLFGLYLSWLAAGPGEPNLLRPIVAHALYDYLAFVLVVREYRRMTARADERQPDVPAAGTTRNRDRRGDS